MTRRVGTWRAARLQRGGGYAEYLILLAVVAIGAMVGFRMYSDSAKSSIDKQGDRILAMEGATPTVPDAPKGGTAAPGVGKAKSGLSVPGVGEKAPPVEAVTPKAVPPKKTPPADTGAPDEVKKLAKFSPTTKAAIAAMEKYKVKIKTGKKGGGSFFDSSTNTVTLDPDNGKDVDTFVHEMNHAIYHHTGKHADPKKMKRDEYVTATIAEEIEGSVQGAQAVYEILAAGGTQERPPFFDAYTKGVAEAKKKNPKATDAQLQTAGRAALRQRLHDAFYKGEFVTSNTKVTYPVYYGQFWDSVNKKKP